MAQQPNILRFTNANERWWRKPLVSFAGRTIPAELAILNSELRNGEDGVWLNSRGLVNGVNDLIMKGGKRRSQRVLLPAFVSVLLNGLLTAARVRKGLPDLVIWSERSRRVRLVEVKCPVWDRPTAEQLTIFKVAAARGIEAKIVEWKFVEAG